MKNTSCFWVGLKAHSFSNKIIVPENDSISVGGSLLLEFLFSPTIGCIESFGIQILSGQLRSLKILPLIIIVL